MPISDEALHGRFRQGLNLCFPVSVRALAMVCVDCKRGPLMNWHSLQGKNGHNRMLTHNTRADHGLAKKPPFIPPNYCFARFCCSLYLRNKKLRVLRTSAMKNILVVLTGCILLLGQVAYAAQGDCLTLPTDDDMQGDILVALASQTDDSELLQIDFEEALFCIIDRNSSDLDGQASTAMYLNSSLDELAIYATIDGLDAWLRVDFLFSDAMVLDRVTSEELGLTEAEFLGDNSLLEASDFFVEFMNSLKIGEFEMADVEVNVPRLDAPYDHYAGREPRPDMPEPNAEFLTVGSIGEVVLEGLLMTFDFANDRIYTTQAR